MFFFLPGEPQLVNTLLSQRHAASQQAGSDLCMQLPGRETEAAKGKQRPVSALGTPVYCTVGRYDLTGWLAQIVRSEQG